MSDDLDDRIAYLRQQRQLEGAAQTRKAADLIQAIDELQELVRTTSFKATTAQGQMQVLEAQMDALEGRVQRIRRYLIGAIVASVLLIVAIIVATLWVSGNLKTAAWADANTLSIAHAYQVEAARMDETKMATRQAEISAQFKVVIPWFWVGGTDQLGWRT